MEQLLKDYLVDNTDARESSYSLTCAVCGSVWRSKARPRRAAAAIDDAASEAAQSNHICRFCGRPVCKGCFEDVEGISLCVQCGEKLRKRLDDRQTHI